MTLTFVDILLLGIFWGIIWGTIFLTRNVITGFILSRSVHSLYKKWLADEKTPLNWDEWLGEWLKAHPESPLNKFTA